MSEPLERWNEDAPERFRAAKAAYAQLGPDADQLERMLRRVAQAPAASGASAPTRAGFGSTTWYWLLPVVAVLGAACFWMVASRPAARPSVPTPATVERALPQASPAGPDALTDELNAGAEPPPPSAPAASAAAPRNARRPPTARASDPLAELLLLERARRVVVNDPARALAVAAQHAREYRTGQLAEERELLAIEALVRLDRRAAAEWRAQLFRRSHPNSVHAHRLGVILSPERR